MSRVVDVTIGKHDSSITYLTTSDFKVLEFPSSLLPDNIKTGAVLKIQIDFNESLAKETNNKFIDFQNNLLDKITTFKPKKPELFVKTKLPTSITLAWEPLNLGIAKLKNVSLWHKSLTPNFSGSSETVDEEEVFSLEEVDEEELSQIATIYNIQNRTYKLTGLDISSKHVFQLRIDTSNGIYSSEMMLAETLSSNDLSGFNICVGALSDGSTTFDDIKAVADALSISQLSRQCNEDTTHYITDTVDDENEEHDLQLNVAKNLNIPIVKPNWLQGCLKEKQLLGVKKFYYKLDKDDKNNLSEQYPFEKSFTEDYLNKIKVVEQQQKEEHKEEVKEAEKVKEDVVKTPAEEETQEPDTEEFVLEKKEDEEIVEDPVLKKEEQQITEEVAPTETVDVSADKETPEEEIIEEPVEGETIPDIAEETVTEAPIEQPLEEINETENIKEEEEENEVPLAEDPITKLSTEKTNTISETPEVKEQTLTEAPATNDNVDPSLPEQKQDPSLTPSSSTSSKKTNKKNKNKKK